VQRASSPSRLVLLAAVAAAAATGLVACGGDDEEIQQLTFVLTAPGQYSAPPSAEAGEAEITLRNQRGGEGDLESDLQLIRVEGDHSAEEVVQALGGAMEGKPLPDWFFAAGGVATTGPGESRTVTQVLEPGTYYAFDTEGTEGPPDPKSVPAIEVTGEESDEEVEADTTVSAFEYGFDADTLSSGETEIAFDNSGAQPHHLIASPAVGDATAEEVETFFKTEKGKPPIEEKGTQTTAVIEGGEGQVVTLDLEPGRYILYCFISDRQGGPPHALKGMVDEVEVE
jgi:hypothetical protein